MNFPKIKIKKRVFQNACKLANALKNHKDYAKTKLGYAAKRFLELNMNVYSSINSQMNDIQREFAMTDEKTNEILENPNGSFKYTPENNKKIEVRIEKLMETEVEVTCFLVPEQEEKKLTENLPPVYDDLTGLIWRNSLLGVSSDEEFFKVTETENTSESA